MTDHGSEYAVAVQNGQRWHAEIHRRKQPPAQVAGEAGPLQWLVRR